MNVQISSNGLELGRYKKILKESPLIKYTNLKLCKSWGSFQCNNRHYINLKWYNWAIKKIELGTSQGPLIAKTDFLSIFYLWSYPFESIFQKFCSKFFTYFKVLENPTYGPVHLDLFRPSVIRGPWTSIQSVTIITLYKSQVNIMYKS